MEVGEAYRKCEAITRVEAKNFAYGIRLLPKAKRRAMSALYAMARRIDDIGDGPLPADQKLVRLAEVRRVIEALADGALPNPSDPIVVGLRDAADRFPIPIEVLGEIVAGCELDAAGSVYATFDDTVRYCRLVAGSVGRLSLGVFGHDGNRQLAMALADELGVALQLTNILRDVVEDQAMGRVYLPQRDLETFECSPDLSGPVPNVISVIGFEAERAKRWFDQGIQLLPMLDHRSRACVAAMAGIYRRLLYRIESDPAEVLRGRMSLSTHEKAWVAVRSLAGATS